MLNRTFLSRALLISSVAFLPGCKPLDWLKEKTSCCSCSHDGEDVKIEGVEPEVLKETVVSIDGRPSVTGYDFEKNYQMLLEAQPSLKEMLPYLPQEQQDHMFGQLIESLAMEKLMTRWVHDSGIDKTAEYRKNAKRVHEAVDRDLALRAFESDLLKEIVITDQEAQEYYAAQKDKDPVFQRPPFAVTVGGTKAKVVEFSNEKDAREFATKARAADFDRSAKEAKKNVVDYGLVSQNSFIDNDVKAGILAATKFPSVDVMKGSDGKFRVVKLASKQQAKFADFDNVKDAVKQVLTGKKFNDIYQKRMAELKEKYKLETNKDYVQKRKPKVAAPEAEQTAAESEQGETKTTAATHTEVTK